VSCVSSVQQHVTTHCVSVTLVNCALLSEQCTAVCKLTVCECYKDERLIALHTFLLHKQHGCVCASSSSSSVRTPLVVQDAIRQWNCLEYCNKLLQILRTVEREFLKKKTDLLFCAQSSVGTAIASCVYEVKAGFTVRVCPCVTNLCVCANRSSKKTEKACSN
jgi:hypothetical protein